MSSFYMKPKLLVEKTNLNYKILVVGEISSGKTSIIKRYVHSMFSMQYKSTIGVDFALKVLEWDSRTTVRLQLWDIAGQERFASMTRVYYKDAVGAFVVFDVTRNNTFDAIKRWKDDIDSKEKLPGSDKPIPVVILVNKIDLVGKEGWGKTKEEMDNFCEEHGFAGWFAASAKDDIGINEAAEFLVKNIIEKLGDNNKMCVEDINSVEINNILNSKSTLTVKEGNVTHFLVTQSKGPNYLEHCNEPVLPTDATETIRKYTEHTNELYSKVNLSLASDSILISDYAKFIKELRSSIISKPLLDDGPYYRGVDLSPIEIEEMEKLKYFFIPSFTSTSLEKTKAYEKSALLVIDTSYMCPYACSITEELSAYHSQEKEVLLACYSSYRLTRIEKVNNQQIISLFLDEIGSGLDRL